MGWAGILLLLVLCVTQAGPTLADTPQQQVSISGNRFVVNGSEIWFNGINTPWHLFDEQWWTDGFARYPENHINTRRYAGVGKLSDPVTFFIISEGENK